MWIIKRIYSVALKLIEAIFGIDIAKKFDTKLRFHKDLNLKNPKTLSDKVTYLELHRQSELAITCTDKYNVREYVESKGLEKILIPVVGGPWHNVDEIDFDGLPNKYVIKATHGCKMNYIVSDRLALDKNECKKTLSNWLSVTYGTYSMEPHYTRIPHRLYAETFLDEIDDLIDYKFHCINGIPEFVLTCSNRKASHEKAMEVTLDLYDMNWKHIPEIIGIGSEVAGKGFVEKPRKFSEMVDIAKRLSEGIDFVRVDLYEYRGTILFGEMTFSPACCVFPYFSKSFDEKMGEKLVL